MDIGEVEKTIEVMPSKAPTKDVPVETPVEPEREKEEVPA